MKFRMEFSLVILVLTCLLGSQAEMYGQELNDYDYKQYVEYESRSFTNKQSFVINTITDSYDIRYHRLDVSIDPTVNYIDGSVATYFEVLSLGFDKITFNFADTTLVVDSIIYHNIKIDTLNIIHNNDLLTISLPGVVTQNSVDSIKIFYHGAPVATGYGSFRIGTDCDSKPVMWTLSEPFGAKDWWPCKVSLKDKVDSLDVFVTTPSLYKVASNGVLESSIITGSDITFHWKHRYPVATYLIAIAIGEYTEIVDWAIFANGDSLKILNYVYACHLASANANLHYTIDDMLLFNDLFGTYPFANEKYGHASCNFGGGMEHQTMSFMGGYNHGLIAHELAHQWFGDRVTCGGWQHIWLNEGWATYSEGMTVENGIQSGSWNGWLQSKINYITSVPNGSVFIPAADSTKRFRIFNYRWTYSKGAMVLHMLRWKLGDADFFTAVKNYLADPNIGYDFALTDQFKHHLEIVSGLNLEEFFNDWFYGEGWPTYNFTWSQDNYNRVHLKVDQLQSHASVGFFELPIPIFFSDGTQDTTIVVDPSFSGEIFGLQLGFAASIMEFDPDNWILAKHSITLPLDYISFIGARDNDVIELSWLVENMFDVIEFEIQRSRDGTIFETIAKMGIDENRNRYHYIDNSSNDKKEVYYRISSIDINGENSYSDVIRLFGNFPDFRVELFPNPIIKSLTLDIVSEIDEVIEISIIDFSGRKIKNISLPILKGKNEEEIMMQDIFKGEYYLQLNSSNSTQVFKIIKQ